MSSRLPHLVRRFLGVLRAGPLGPEEQAVVAALLRQAEWGLFWGQPAADQRHGLDCALALLARRPERPDLARAALLHDVGKRHAGLGPVGRTLAISLHALRLPLRGRLAQYQDHGPRGAIELEAVGAEAIVVGFARHHHGRPWAGAAPADWEELSRADRR